MVKYKKIYFDYFNIIDYVSCEVCNSEAVDIHHIKYKSRGGKDEISNLMALCRDCHDKAHNEELKESELIKIHQSCMK